MVEAAKQQEDAKRLEVIQKTFSTKDIRTVYAFEKLIGGGHFGSVRIAHRITDPQVKYAVKSILLENVKENVKFLEEELMILQQVDHPNIIKFHESYMDHRYVHIVMELSEGGELFEKIVELQSFPEKKAAKLMDQITSAILHMHEKGICHRDIKPENFMFSDKSEDSELKLIDFGLSKRFGANEGGAPGGDFMHSIVGTPYYVAPEVLEGNYGFECDVWSLGIILYILLCGYPPFEGDNNKEIFKRVMTQKVEFDPAEWSDISQEAKDLIKLMLVRDPTKRITLPAVRENAWFKTMREKHDASSEQSLAIMNRLRSFRAPKRLQLEAMTFLANNLPNSQQLDMSNLRKVFKSMDKTNTGYLTTQDIEEGLKQLNIPEQEIKEMFKSITQGSQGDKINYSTFLAATIDRKKTLTLQNLQFAFHHFDTKNQGQITKEDMREVFRREGRPFTENDLVEMFGTEEAITFEQFSKSMLEILEKENSQEMDLS